MVLNRVFRSPFAVAEIGVDYLCRYYEDLRSYIVQDLGDIPASDTLQIRKILENFQQDLQSLQSLQDVCAVLGKLLYSVTTLHGKLTQIIGRKFLQDISAYLAYRGFIQKPIDFRSMDCSKFTYNVSGIAEWLYHNISRSGELSFDDERSDYWPSLGDASIEICGFRYLTYDNCLVTLNGGLIEIETAGMLIEKTITNGGGPNDFEIQRDAIERYMFNGGKPLSTIDGITFGESSKLVCLDVDHLTGMVMDNKFYELVENLRQNGKTLLDIAELDESSLLNESVIARVKRLKKYIKIASARFFRDKVPAKGKPLLMGVMPLAGADTHMLDKVVLDEMPASGYVHASADKARQCSKLFEFYTECRHHNDDYKSLQSFSNVLMEEVLKLSIDRRYNCFIEGTGDSSTESILFHAKKAKSMGYDVEIAMGHVGLYVENDRKDDMAAPAYSRIMRAARVKKRAISSWEIMLKQHTKQAVAFLDLCKDTDFQKVYLYDTTCAKESIPVIAFVKEVEHSVLDSLLESKKFGKGYLFSKLNDLDVFDGVRIGRDFKLARLDFLIGSSVGADRRRIIVILDIVKFIDVMQKGIMYDRAFGYDEVVFNSCLAHSPIVDYPFDKRRDDEVWMLRNQMVSNESYLL